MPELVKEIFELEKKAEEAIRRAEEEKAKKIVKAKEDAFARISQRKKEIEEKVDAEIRSKLREIEKKKAEIKARFLKEAEETGKKGEKNLKKGVNLLLEKAVGEQ